MSDHDERRTAWRTCPLCEATCGLEITLEGPGGAALADLLAFLPEGATLVAHRLRSLLLVVLAAACPWLGGLIGPAFPADPAGATAIFIANAILFALILSELVIEVVHIVRFRMIA